MVTLAIDFQPGMMNHSFKNGKVKFQLVIKHVSSTFMPVTHCFKIPEIEISSLA